LVGEGWEVLLFGQELQFTVGSEFVLHSPLELVFPSQSCLLVNLLHNQVVPAFPDVVILHLCGLLSQVFFLLELHFDPSFEVSFEGWVKAKFKRLEVFAEGFEGEGRVMPPKQG
jgi:hypothetical protein